MRNTIKKVGFLVENLSPSQLCYQLINSANAVLGKSDLYDFCLFYRNFGPAPIPCNFGTFTAYEGFAYNGIMVATDFFGAEMITRWPGPNRNKMYYYMNNLDWLLLRSRFQYEQLAQVYLHPKLNLIVRSESHKDIVNACWKEPYGVVEGANVARLVEII